LLSDDVRHRITERNFGMVFAVYICKRLEPMKSRGASKKQTWRSKWKAISLDREVIMTPNGNEFTYAKQFEGNLHGAVDPVPARVHTNLRMMSRDMVEELRRLDHRASGAPQYVFVRRNDLPLHTTLQATGQHYFEW